MPPRSTLNQKQIVVRRFMDILAASGVYLHPQSGHRYIKWTFFPDHVWERGVYVRLPREIVFDTPHQTVEHRIKHPLRAPWTDETVEIMREALDAGKVQILPRTSDRPIVFEVFDKDGTITDVPRFLRRERNQRKIRESGSVSQDYDDEEDEEDEEEDEDEDETYSMDDEPAPKNYLQEIYRILRQLYRNANLDASSTRNMWADLPKLMAKRKLYLVGLPAICAPFVNDDEVVSDSLPEKWTTQQCEKFIAAGNTGQLKLVRKDTNMVVLYQLANENGSITNSTLQYSPAWLQRNMQASVVNNESLFQRNRRSNRDTEKSGSRIPANAVITSSGRGWVVVEESTDEEEDPMAADNPKEQRKKLRTEMSARVVKQIIDFDIRGDGTEVTWNSLPLALAQSNKYMVGFPPGSLPKIKDDKVVFQASHPSLWSGEVIQQMQESLDSKRVQVLPRPPGRIVLFEVEENGKKHDSTLGFSADWLALNIDDPVLADRKQVALAKLQKERLRAQSASSSSAGKEKEERLKEKKPIPLKPREEAAKKSATDKMTKRLEEKAKLLEDKQKGQANLRIASAMMGFGNPPARSAQPFITSRNRTSHSSGTSTPRSDILPQSSNILSPVTPSESSHAAFTPAISAHPRLAFKSKQRASFSTNGSGNYAHLSRQSSTDDIPMRESPPAIDSPTMPLDTWPPPGYPRHYWTESYRPEMLNALVRFFDRHAFSEKSVPSTWLRLPEILARRNQYLRGVPFICIPVVKNDQVEQSSEPTQWSSKLACAMDWSLKSNTLTVKARPPGRRVLFEIIGADGSYSDSMLGYSEEWIDTQLIDTPKESTITNGHASLSPIASLKRSRSSASPTGTLSAEERQIKRQRMDADGDEEMEPLVDSEALIKEKPQRPFAITLPLGPRPPPPQELHIDPRKLPLDRLIPRSLPKPLRSGRVFLRFGLLALKLKLRNKKKMKYPQNNGMKLSTIWNASQGQWRVIAESRSLEHLGMVPETMQPTPTRITSNILRRGQCLYNDSREQWEMDFGDSFKDAAWRVKWDPGFGRWEYLYLKQ